MGLLDGMFTGGGGFSVGKAPQTAASFFLGGRKPRPAAPTLPTLEAPPTRDIRGEADTTGKTALASLLFNRLFGGSVQPAAALLGGMRKGYDSKFGNELADVQRTNQTALQQFGANQAGFGNELRLDGLDRQDQMDAFTVFRDNRNWDRVIGRDAISDARFAENRDFQQGRATRADFVSDRAWEDFLKRQNDAKAAQDFGLLTNATRFQAGLDPASQSQFRTSAAEVLGRRGMKLPDGTISAAQRPADPSKMSVDDRFTQMYVEGLQKTINDPFSTPRAREAAATALQKVFKTRIGSSMPGMEFRVPSGKQEMTPFQKQQVIQGNRRLDLAEAANDIKAADFLINSWKEGKGQPTAVDLFGMRDKLQQRLIEIDQSFMAEPVKAKWRETLNAQLADLEQFGGQPVQLAPNPKPVTGAPPKPPTRATGGVIRDPSKVSTGGLMKRLAEKYGGK
jgi:hypothetical protein